MAARSKAMLMVLLVERPRVVRAASIEGEALGTSIHGG
jgi:hypothetical protein